VPQGALAALWVSGNRDGSDLEEDGLPVVEQKLHRQAWVFWCGLRWRPSHAARKAANNGRVRGWAD